MSKYINAEEYAKKLDYSWEYYFSQSQSTEGIDTALSILEDMPSADVVEVVRCKDCKYSVCIPRNIGEDWFCDIKYNEWGEPWGTSPEGFCDCGERKETE